MQDKTKQLDTILGARLQRSQVVMEAESWIGTPWIHNGMVKKIGCDCVGFIVGVTKAVGVIPFNYQLTNYSRVPRNDYIIKHLAEYLVETTSLEEGNILVFRIHNLITHVGFYCQDEQLIHAEELRNTGVVKVPLGDYKNKIENIYQIPNITNG